MIANLALFIVIAIVGGLGSSWYMVERGTRLTTRAEGPWTTWTAAGRQDADPYTRAHFIRRGMLPISSTLVQSFHAATDSDGQALYSSCDYVIEGEEPQAAFWSIAVFDEKGRLIPNSADRYSYNSATLLRATGGRMDVTLSRSARPGNWLPTGGAGRLALALTLEEPRAGPNERQLLKALPPIRRIACR